jgi:hypothetical protein
VDGKQILRSVTAASEMEAATMSRIEDEGTTLLDMAIAIPKLSTLTGKIDISYISTTLIPVNLNANLWCTPVCLIVYSVIHIRFAFMSVLSTKPWLSFHNWHFYLGLAAEKTVWASEARTFTIPDGFPIGFDKDNKEIHSSCHGFNENAVAQGRLEKVLPPWSNLRWYSRIGKLCFRHFDFSQFIEFGRNSPEFDWKLTISDLLRYQLEFPLRYYS